MGKSATSTKTKSQRLALSVQQQCQQRLQLPLTTRILNDDTPTSNSVSRYSFGQPSVTNKEWRTILLVGARGSGKKTLIDSMINYILGVHWHDEFRFQLQEQVQTTSVNVFDIHYQEGFRIPYSLTIVDTPGFSDVNDDFRKIIGAINELFAPRGDSTQKLDAVGFVIPSTVTLLLPAPKSMFESLLDIFGDDVKDRTSFLVTCSDGHVPVVLDAIKAAKWPCKLDGKGLPVHQLFNSSALFVSNKILDGCSERFWQLSVDNWKSSFCKLTTIKNRQSLQSSGKMLFNMSMKLLRECVKAEPSVPEIIRFIRMGADVNLRTRSGSTRLMTLCAALGRRHDAYGCVKALLEESASCGRRIEINATVPVGSYSLNALMVVLCAYAEDNLIDIVKLLIAHGIDVAHNDNLGLNALQFACIFYRKENLIEIVRLFIKHGVNVGHRNLLNGFTAFDYFQSCTWTCGNRSQIAFLLNPNK